MDRLWAGLWPHLDEGDLAAFRVRRDGGRWPPASTSISPSRSSRTRSTPCCRRPPDAPRRWA